MDLIKILVTYFKHFEVIHKFVLKSKMYSLSWEHCGNCPRQFLYLRRDLHNRYQSLELQTEVWQSVSMHGNVFMYISSHSIHLEAVDLPIVCAINVDRDPT